MPELKEVAALVQAWLAVAVIGGIAAALASAYSRAARRPFPHQRRRAVIWTGPLVTTAFVAFFFIPPMILSALDPAALARCVYGADVEEKTARRLAASAAGVMALPLQVAMWFGLLRMAGATLSLSRQRAAGEVVSGYCTWVFLTPLVYVLNGVVLVVYGLVVGKQPEKHPILLTFEDGSAPAALVVLLVVESVLAAPVREELFFRGVLQPWLSVRPWGGDFALAAAGIIGVLLRVPSAQEAQGLTALASALAPVAFVLALVPLNMLLDRWPGLARWLPVRDPNARRQAAQAVFGSAAVFANFHVSVWPTPIALFVLALGLGWLAYRAQSVFAPIIVHMLFNAVALGALFFR